jgi:glucose/arabinose dehydrogenase
MSMRKVDAIVAAVAAAGALWAAATSGTILTGQAAFTDYKKQQPGTIRRITAADLPKPYATTSSENQAHMVRRPDGAQPVAPTGFNVQLLISGLSNPREIRTAPNGDLFVAESDPGQIEIFQVSAAGKLTGRSVFATGLEQPFGIAFYPPGPNPQWIYVGNTGSVVRIPYKNGDLKATGKPEVILSDIPSGGRLTGGGHWTRDLAFSLDGKRLFVAVGSATNVSDPDTNKAEFHRGDILTSTPGGKSETVYASGIRNPVGIAIQPETGALWTSVNERDELGDNLVPDYITHVQEGGFYGWPWFYIGGNQDPRHAGKHPELKSKVIVPDVLLQPHNASLELTFYEGSQFPQEYKGDIFAAEHGSWNKAVRTGYEVVRVPLKNGKAGGEYQDFLTGFVNANGDVWGRPVGVAVARDGSLIVTDDGSNSIWRVSYGPK